MGVVMELSLAGEKNGFVLFFFLLLSLSLAELTRAKGKENCVPLDKTKSSTTS